MLILFFSLCLSVILKINYEFLISCSYVAYYSNSIEIWTLIIFYINLLILTKQKFCLVKCTFSSCYRAVCEWEDSRIVPASPWEKKIKVGVPQPFSYDNQCYLRLSKCQQVVFFPSGIQHSINSLFFQIQQLNQSRFSSCI